MTPEPVYNITGLPAEDPEHYWHVFGGAIQGKKGGKNNWATFVAGPVTRGPDATVTDTTIPGTDGETFSYLGSFTHDPSPEDLDTITPEAYR